ncbi:putative aldehyde dehydrogenase [Sphingobium jiangsuense]|uniref:Acyl-CoA reductase-like NAD-dependent aldehyde dehydrogenase n=1 Tax=Sphingobium jiangsuense TaxID=870476 RepID=A0A7W6BL88_9SPHN|nr:aldehyde dehydrogenase [Sphingobium jiangsuense]MBB3925795.1 acyl-CoA reductase-like NAD-dependent aldehyde dehydrogenase [Sphingobium jiangsuense]GLT00961.1 putative aldehyde dehydrogenase [Sphingobium jiangsuense]
MTAFATDAPTLVHPDKLFIGGRWVAPAGDRKFRLVNPANEEQFCDVPEASTEDMEAAVAAARRAFDKGPWPRMAPAERAAKMRAIGAGLQKRAEALDKAWTAQIGTPVLLSRGSSRGGPAILDYYATLAEGYAFEDVRKSNGFMSKVAVVVKEPVGVVAAVAPWNGPLMTMLSKVAPALAAGCTVICKPSPETPLEMFLFAEAVEEAGLPEGVVNILPADREVSDQLISHPGIDKVSFTGSTAAGLHIASVCASRMARFTMELGGKSAAIVLDDFDPAKLGPMLAPLVTMMSGQVCINNSRVLVPRAKHDAYVESLSASMAAVKVGNPLEDGIYMGPLAMKRQMERVQYYIEKGKAEGARIATGGGRPADLNQGYFIAPTVFTGVDNGMTIAQEEIFGPVTAVIPYDDEEQAAEIANASEFGLSGAVFTEDTDRAYAMARRIRTGHYTQNGREFDLTNPFGGFKKSGVGREGGPEGMDPYLEIKTVFLPQAPSHLA